MSLSQSFNLTKEFSVWIHEKTNDKNIPSGIRERTAVAILQHSLDVGDAIIILLEQLLPGPALTLARPLFEGYVRGIWLLKFASDKEIENFLRGKCPEFYEVLEAIGTDMASGAAWVHANKDANWKSFNGLTHGGSEHVKRRDTNGVVEPNYPESELEALIRFGIEVRIRIGAELLALMGDETALAQLHKRANHFRLSSSQAK